jgi:putative transposase
VARPLRFAFSGASYHVYCRGNRKDPIFLSDQDYLVFIRKLDEAMIKYECVCYTYCLMANHYHVYIKTLRPNISEAIHYLNSGYSNWFKAKHAIVGHVFQGRFGSILVDDSAYALFLSSYIHLNPVRAEICTRPGEYRWSSYEIVCGRRMPPIRNFDRGFVLGFLHPDFDLAVPRYEKYVKDMMRSPRLKPPLTQRAFLGSDEFAREIRAKFNIEGDRREIPRVLRQDPNGPTHESILSTVRRVLAGRSTVHRDNPRFLSPPGAIEEAGARSKKDLRLERKFAIYLETKFLGQSLGKIGLRWGMDYGAVAQLVHRMELKRGSDRKLESALAEAEESLLAPGPTEMSNVKT